jgi:hypothetical protein
MNTQRLSSFNPTPSSHFFAGRSGSNPGAAFVGSVYVQGNWSGSAAGNYCIVFPAIAGGLISLPS